MSRLKVTQVRSLIDRPREQRDTVRRLGLHRIDDTVVKDDRPEIRGMIEKVRHLVTVEELGEDAEQDGERPARARKGTR